VPYLTFAATANTVAQTGATPIFADVKSLDDWTIDPADVARKITNRTKAVVPMHYAGYACEMALCTSVYLVGHEIPNGFSRYHDTKKNGGSNH
jgi:dTDP-4-amino-4,6-dideoxygalactose transaminase